MKTSLMRNFDWKPLSYGQHFVQHDRAVINKQTPRAVAADPVAQEMIHSLDADSYVRSVNFDLVTQAEQAVDERGRR